LLSNGEEDNKGTALLQETHQLLKQLPGLNFIGNVESKEVMHGEVDVVVMDGFTGNIFLKTVEATVSYFQSVLRESLTSSLPNKLLAAGLKPAFGKIRKRMDYEEYGGAPLLGIDGVVIITHGRMKAKGIKNSIRVGRDVAQNGTVEAIRTLLTTKPQPTATATSANENEKDKEVVG
jgi:glycerol-3-phosphate acyltransferase PlsX